MGLQDSKNYSVGYEWTPLTDIMGDDYETTDEYKVRVNTLRPSSIFGYTYRTGEPPTDNDRGGEYPQYSEFEIKNDTGDDVYFRCTGNNANIEISYVKTVN